MSTLSRIIPGPGNDNTGRNFNKDLQTPASASVINLLVSQYETLVIPSNLTGSVTINANTGNPAVGSPSQPYYIPATSPFLGDQLQLLLNSTSGATVTFGTGFSVSAATSVVGAAKNNSIAFIFTGVVWQELSRSVGI